MSADARMVIHLLTLKCGPPLDKEPSRVEIKLAERMGSLLKDFEARQLEVDEDVKNSNNQDMNAVVIYILCPYLDTSSLFCLSAAYPEWSGVVHDYLKKKSWKLHLRLEFASTSGRAHPVIWLSRTGTVKLKTESEGWEDIPVSHWKYVPFEVLNFSSIEIIQCEESKDLAISFSKELFDMLARVTTGELTMKFDGCNTARRVLETIRFRPDSFVTLVDMSAAQSEYSTLQNRVLANCKTLEYRGERCKLWKELKTILNADYVTLIVMLSDALRTLVKKVVESYMDEQAGRVHCTIVDGRGMSVFDRYEFENAGRHAPGRTNQLRLIYVWPGSPRGSRNMHGVLIVVKNLKRRRD